MDRRDATQLAPARSKLTLSIGAALVCIASTASAHPGSEPPPDDLIEPAPQYKANGVVVDEHLGAKLPLETAFRTQDGMLTTLGDVIAGPLPTILTFNYSDCPMLCSLQLNGLSAVLPSIGEGNLKFRIGAQFKLVTIDLEPNESPEKLARMREKYIERLPEAYRAEARAGWTFLAAPVPGIDVSIRRVADAVGFHYMYVPERAEWAHPAALIFLSTAGTVTRYVYGIEFDPAIMRESIFKAGAAESATAVGFMNRCFHYDPDANSHARAGVLALRIGAAGFVVLMLSGFGLMHFLKKHRTRNGVTS